MKKERVYCGECRHFDGDKSCRAKENIKEVHTWKKIEDYPKRLAESINRNNDCAWFKKA